MCRKRSIDQVERQEPDDGFPVGVGEHRFAVLALERDELADRKSERTY
jgi:hypothetical protein